MCPSQAEFHSKAQNLLETLVRRFSEEDDEALAFPVRRAENRFLACNISAWCYRISLFAASALIAVGARLLLLPMSAY